MPACDLRSCKDQLDEAAYLDALEQIAQVPPASFERAVRLRYALLPSAQVYS